MASPTTQAVDSAPLVLLCADEWLAEMGKRFPSVRDQARETGIHHSALYRMLRGEHGPKPDTARRMVAVSQIPLQRLFKLAES